MAAAAGGLVKGDSAAIVTAAVDSVCSSMDVAQGPAGATADRRKSQVWGIQTGMRLARWAVGCVAMWLYRGDRGAIWYGMETHSHSLKTTSLHQSLVHNFNPGSCCESLS